jgi:aminocarboxymuconate-semialdehyde decarboxylase
VQPTCNKAQLNPATCNARSATTLQQKRSSNFEHSKLYDLIKYSYLHKPKHKTDFMLKIDMHTHIIPKHLPDWTKKFGYGDFIFLNHRDDGKADMMQGGKFFRTIEENCWDEKIRIKEYQDFSTRTQVVCTIPVMFSYWAKPADCLELSRYLNDHIAELVTLYPKNYIGLGTIPMQDSELAVQELERMKSIGLVGIQIGSNINDENLSEEKFFPIFEACERLGLAIMIHPWQMMGFDSMKKYWLPWLVGMPAETSRAACSLIFGGVLERLPNLRICLSHAGGSFLPTLGRIEHGFNCRPDLVAIDNPINPREYLGKFWVDCITHDIDLLEYILKMQGSKRVCLGTDYPFPLGDLEIGKFIEDSNLSQQVIEDIFSNATLEWLNLDKNDYI